MATWEEIAKAIQQAKSPDGVRRAKLKELSDLTGRPVIVYAVDMFNRAKIQNSGGDISIDLSDKDGFFETIRDIEGDNLDVILHSPGGSPEATESIVKLLRSRFKNIRFIIPNIAKSAATMLAMSGDEIILGDNAELGPTDPQMVINNHLSPAHAILEQFDKAKKDLNGNSDRLPAWLPILQQYGPSLLVECENARSLTETLVKEWLAEYMLKGDSRAKSKASVISKFLANKKHLSHGRAIQVAELQAKGVKIQKASQCTPALAEILQDVNYTLLLTFQMTGVYKMFENYKGKGLYKAIQQQQIVLPFMPGMPGGPAAPRLPQQP
jgi:hypothetical protein